MEHHKFWVAIELALILILTVNIAGSQAQGDSPTYFACINKSSGSIRIVTSSTSCKKNETKISWNQIGPQGPQGEPGPAGPPGEVVDRYVDLSDGTVLDRHTGLVWLKDANCDFLSPNNWTNSNMRAAKIESGICGLTDGSWEGDWRLPTKTEWMATVAEAKAMGCTDPALTDITGTSCYSTGIQWAENIIFSGCGYWTSTPHFSVPGTAPYIHLSNGGFGPGDKENTCFNAWPVRKGQEGKIE
jgi:hypothetical protein